MNSIEHNISIPFSNAKQKDKEKYDNDWVFCKVSKIYLLYTISCVGCCMTIISNSIINSYHGDGVSVANLTQMCFVYMIRM